MELIESNNFQTRLNLFMCKGKGVCMYASILTK